MKIIFCLVTLCASLIIHGQGDKNQKGIKWKEGFSWSQLKAIAKAEGKFIFLDCFASWCVPCKYMDNEVFSNDTVRDFMENKFICAKVQMDTTKEDSDDIKKRYEGAKHIRLQYDVSGFPTFLFFDQDGRIVHKDIGGKSIDEFMILAANALTPGRQLYTLLERYNQGRREYNEMGYLAKFLMNAGDEKLARVIAKDYVTNYLFRLADDQLFTNENIEFIGSFIESSSDIYFNFFYRHIVRINKVLKNGIYTRYKIDFIISKEEIDPILNRSVNSNGSEPLWKKMYTKIKRKYNQKYAERSVFNAKERWYQYNGNWSELHKRYVERYRKYGISDISNGNNIDGVTNNMAWEVFEHSHDKQVLLEAVEWMGKMIKETNLIEGEKANMMDTYANLLYKAGKMKEAIEWETKAIEVAKRNDWNNWVKAWTETLSKMQNGEATWP